MEPNKRLTASLIVGQADCIAQLCDVAARITSGLTIPGLDSYEMLAASLLEKQIEHARGILLLGAHPDARLIARAMMEVYWQVDWATNDPQSRAWRWSAFSMIKDWRTMLYREANREAVPSEEKAAVFAWIDEFGKEFEVPKKRKKRRVTLANGVVYEDPYVMAWHGMSVAGLARAAGDYGEYLRAYSVFSDRVHSDTVEIARSLEFTPGQVLYNGASPEGHVAALHTAFEYLWWTARVVDQSLSRGLADEILALGDRYKAVGEAAGIGIAPPLMVPEGDATIPPE